MSDPFLERYVQLYLRSAAQRPKVGETFISATHEEYIYVGGYSKHSVELWRRPDGSVEAISPDSNNFEGYLTCAFLAGLLVGGLILSLVWIFWPGGRT